MPESRRFLPIGHLLLGESREARVNNQETSGFNTAKRKPKHGGASGKISCWLSKNQMISDPKSPPKVTSSHLTAARRPAGARVSERRLTAKVELLPTWPSQPPSSGVQLAMKALWMARFGVLVKEKALVTWSTRAHSPHQYMHSHTGVVSSQSLNPLLNHKKRG